MQISSTYFLEATGSVPDTPNYVNAQTAGISFLNYSLPTIGSLTATESQTLLDGGVAIAVAEANATFSEDPTFTTLFTSSEGTGIGGSYASISDSQALVVATFDVSGEQTLSFDFSTGFDLTAKEIEDPDREYNYAEAKAGFLVLDTSSNKPKVLGYYGIQGGLTSSKQTSIFKESIRKSTLKNTTIQDFLVTENVDGDDGLDLLSANVSGTYTQSFHRRISEVTLVQLTESATQLSGDTLIGRLGESVRYGTIGADRLKGNRHNNNLYGSLGDDRILGKQGDDILEGGPGKDRLRGGAGNDKLSGGEDDDILNGGRGSDWLVGGEGADRFVINKLRAGDIDTILDFEVGIDSIKMIAVGQWSSQDFFKDLVDTSAGAQYTARASGQLLFSGVSVAELASANHLFV